MSMIIQHIGNSDEAKVFIEVMEQADSPEDIPSGDAIGLARHVSRFKWQWSPMIVVISGMAAGLVGATRRKLLGVLGAAPYAFLMTVAVSNSQVGMLALYLILAAAGAGSSGLLLRIFTSNKSL